MSNNLIITAYNYADWENNYASILKAGENKTPGQQVDIQSYDVVCQGDKRSCCESRVNVHPVEHQRECRTENGGEKNNNEQ